MSTTTSPTTCRSKRGSNPSSTTATTTIPKSTSQTRDDKTTRVDRKRPLNNNSRKMERPQRQQKQLSDETVEIDLNKLDSSEASSCATRDLECDEWSAPNMVSISSSPPSDVCDNSVKPPSTENPLNTQQLEHNLTLQEFRCSSHCPPKKRALMPLADFSTSFSPLPTDPGMHTDSTSSSKSQMDYHDVMKQSSPTAVEAAEHVSSPSHPCKTESSKCSVDSNDFMKNILSQSPCYSDYSNRVIVTSTENLSSSEKDMTVGKTTNSPSTCHSTPLSSRTPTGNSITTGSPDSIGALVDAKCHAMGTSTVYHRVERVPSVNQHLKLASSVSKSSQPIKLSSRSIKMPVPNQLFDIMVSSKKIATRHVHIAHKICEYNLRKYLALSPKCPLSASDVSKHLRVHPSTLKPIPLSVPTEHSKRPGAIETIGHNVLEQPPELLDLMQLKSAASYFASPDQLGRLHSGWPLSLPHSDIPISTSSLINNRQASPFFSPLIFSKVQRSVSPRAGSSESAPFPITMRPLPIKPSLSYSAPASMQAFVEMGSQAVKQLTSNSVNPVRAAQEDQSLYAPKVYEGIENPYGYLQRYTHTSSKVGERDYRATWNVLNQGQKLKEQHLPVMNASLFMDQSAALPQSVASGPQSYFHRANELSVLNAAPSAGSSSSSSLPRPFPCKPVPDATTTLSCAGSLFIPPGHYQNSAFVPNSFLNSAGSWPPHMLGAHAAHKSQQPSSSSSSAVNIVQPSGCIPKYPHQVPSQAPNGGATAAANPANYYNHSYHHLFGKATYSSPVEAAAYSGPRPGTGSNILSPFRGTFQPVNPPANLRQLPSHLSQEPAANRMPWLPSYYTNGSNEPASLTSHPYPMSVPRFTNPSSTASSFSLGPQYAPMNPSSFAHAFMSPDKKHPFPPNRSTFL